MKLIIHKFKRHSNLTVEVPAQIVGGNGTGKSTILEAFSFCLTGKDLQGNEFKQVYDNREDLHQAVADVEFFDNYGNSFRRVVKPQYSISRAGIEELKIKRSTQCLKNGIETTDFADEFSDFLKFGTDYFFNQKEDVQRQIFIELLKKKMPDYDVKIASLKLKELKKSQKNAVSDVKTKTEQLKGVKDVEVDTIDPEVIEKADQYIALSKVNDPAKVSEINTENNKRASEYFSAKNKLNEEISKVKQIISITETKISQLEEKIKSIESSEFVPLPSLDTEKLKESLSNARNQLESSDYFANIEDYAAKFYHLNPVLVENGKRVKELTERKFEPSCEISSACPLSGEYCTTARLYSEAAERKRFELDIQNQVDEIKRENRQILTREMSDANAKYQKIKAEFTQYEEAFNKAVFENLKIEKDNEFLRNAFHSTKNTEIDTLTCDLNTLKQALSTFNENLIIAQNQLSALKEPELLKMPEEVEISEDILTAYQIFEAKNKEIIGQVAINGNNAKLRDQYNAEIKELQNSLFTIGEEIAKLTTEISDYFSNLQGIVKSEFAGDIEIDVELLEYVLTKDEWKDCFKITANGKVFPYECNGALQNNLKLQILATFQRLKGYSGITLMDNCEANTTQPINTCGLNCVLAYATNDNELIIK